MNRIYRIWTTDSDNGTWVSAPTVGAAVKHLTTDIDSLIDIQDQTEDLMTSDQDHESLRDLLESGTIGIVGKQARKLRIEDILHHMQYGKYPEEIENNPPKWILLDKPE